MRTLGVGGSRGVCGKLCRQFMTQDHPSIFSFSGLVLFSVLNVHLFRVISVIDIAKYPLTSYIKKYKLNNFFIFLYICIS